MAESSSQHPLDQTGVYFRDQIFLNFVGGALNPGNVFDYFATSQFYDRFCNNEQLRLQGIHPLDMSHLTKMTGWEYALHHIQEPHLFVLKKQKRDSPEKTTVVAAYYILDGSIYQAPSLHGVLGARLMRSIHHIRNAFDIVKKNLDNASAGVAEEDAKEALAKGEAEAQKKAERKVDMQQVLRMDQIIFSVLKKLPPPPPPPGSVPQQAMGTPQSTAADAAAQQAAPASAQELKEPSRAAEIPRQGPLKRQRQS